MFAMARNWRMRLVFGILAMALAGCSQSPPQQPLRPVRAMKVGDVGEIARRSFPGRARAADEVNLSFRVSGPLIELPVNVGAKVKRGDVLARIDPRDFEIAVRNAESRLSMSQAQLRAMQIGARPEELEQLRAAVREAEAHFQIANSDLTRATNLFERRTITEAEFDRFAATKARAEADLARARESLLIGERGAREEDIESKQAEISALQAALDNTRDQLDDTTLRAPFDGEVAARFVENFQNVQTKQAIVRLLNISQIEMVVDIPESLISLAPYVTEVACTFDAFPDAPVPARIKTIGSEASTTTRTFPVTLIMDQPDGIRILPGMAGRARANTQTNRLDATEGMTIPEAAIFEEDNGQSAVWIIDRQTDTVNAHPITVLGATSLGMQITGIVPGAWIATAGANTLREGQKVRVMETNGAAAK